MHFNPKKKIMTYSDIPDELIVVIDREYHCNIERSPERILYECGLLFFKLRKISFGLGFKSLKVLCNQCLQMFVEFFIFFNSAEQIL